MCLSGSLLHTHLLRLMRPGLFLQGDKISCDVSELVPQCDSQKEQTAPSIFFFFKAYLFSPDLLSFVDFFTPVADSASHLSAVCAFFHDR